MKVTVFETLIESFDLEVPGDVVAAGEDAIHEWIEAERITGDHRRRFDRVIEVDWGERQ